MEVIEKNVTTNKIGNIMPQAEEALENVKAKGNKVWEVAQEKGQILWNDRQSIPLKSWRQAKSFIQYHPGQAVGYSFFIGALMTVLLYPKGRV
jgi:ElaB/YqjD/DUF883 family membrane-anchored ribosome-binding protein